MAPPLSVGVVKRHGVRLVKAGGPLAVEVSHLAKTKSVSAREQMGEGSQRAKLEQRPNELAKKRGEGTPGKRQWWEGIAPGEML